ncbi:adenylate kinase [Firmicutes bacterium CAG:475]|jgi:adenylate kinases|nr:adenylate kinase [Clostridia bacterium]MBS5851778.1 adenylate kinase [Bacillota bacterium]CDD68367.1 adenylate kinase [Firmicutes bacterium CAG:475]
MKNIILLGAPGAGKGTQAAMIAEEFKVPHISTGDILRRNMKEGTPLGLKAKAFVESGGLVPDEVVIGLVEDRLSQEDCKNGYILDGFPRTIAQAEALDKVARIDLAINIDVPFETIVSRLGGRRVCVCGETYHVSMLNGETTCKRCGKELFIRDDDKPETVKNRLKVYSDQTQPLIDYYRSQNKVVDIKANGTKEEIFADIKKVLE